MRFSRTVTSEMENSEDERVVEAGVYKSPESG